MGLEWAAVLLPALVGLVLHWIFPRKVLWYEAVLPIVPALLIIPLVKCSAEAVQVRDYERRGGWVVEARYFEAWNEYHIQVCTETDSKGNTTVRDCSYVEWHSPYWELEDSNGYVLPITQPQFDTLQQRFGNRVFRDMHRAYHTQDGDQYATCWTGNAAAFQPVFTEHSYENRIQATHGVVDFPEISPQQAKTLGLYEFPKLRDPFNDPAILGKAAGVEQADQYLQQQNAKLGRGKQVRFWILLFHNKPRSVGYDQESYWRGGNKNEVVVTIGLDKQGKPAWCHPFCWAPDGNTSNDAMKIEIRDFVEQQKVFDPLKTAEFVVASAIDKFQRKQFKEFAYLTVDMPTWAHVLVWVLTVLSTVGMGVYVVVNPLEAELSYG